ncbi:translation initiation factor IF-2-like [Serinus canaria]|uniref:translation initiation factor IF-2-like n=1 Tax=Serinus canaria TaxID=9135 RepID=UPI0021CCC470|nr:translation initiation factor IF-2-like [Serinus canaria]
MARRRANPAGEQRTVPHLQLGDRIAGRRRAGAGPCSAAGRAGASRSSLSAPLPARPPIGPRPPGPPRCAGRRRGSLAARALPPPRSVPPPPALRFFCRRRCHPSRPPDSAGPAPSHWAAPARPARPLAPAAGRCGSAGRAPGRAVP